MFLGLSQIDVSTEAIAFQGASEFGKELTALFQSVMDYKASRIKAGSKRVVKEVLNFHMSNVPKKYMKIVEKYTGLQTSSFTTSGAPSLGYACLLKFGKDYEGWLLAHEAIEKYSGDDNQLQASKMSIEEKIKIWEDISKLFDQESGRISKMEVGTKKKIRLEYDVYFCAHSAYLAKETLGPDAEQLTPMEVAAIMIHETGHMMSLVEHAGDVIISQQTATETISIKDIKSLDKKTQQKLANAKAKGLKKFKTRVKALDEEVAKVAQAAETIAAIPKESSVLTRFFGAWIALFQSLAFVAEAAIIGTLARVLTHVFAGTFHYKELMQSFKKKSSDFMKVYGDRALCERYSDEYVARHGFAAPLVSALGKTDSLYPLIAIGGAGRAQFSESSIVYRIAKSATMVATLLYVADETGYGSYESEVRRAESLMLDVVKALKVANLPPAVSDFYIKDYERTRAAVAAVKKKRGVFSVVRDINVLLAQTITPAHLIKLLVTGNIDSKYQQLMDAVKRLGSSELHYQAAKLDQLSR